MRQRTANIVELYLEQEGVKHRPRQHHQTKPMKTLELYNAEIDLLIEVAEAYLAKYKGVNLKTLPLVESNTVRRLRKLVKQIKETEEDVDMDDLLYDDAG